MASSKHATMALEDRWHGKGSGCVHRHLTYYYNFRSGKFVHKKNEVECDYRKNGFEKSKSDRSGDYNSKDHVAIARQKGYLEGRGAIQAAVEQRNAARKRPGSAKKQKRWKAAWQGRLAGPLALLRQDSKAWHINHTYAGRVTPWWGKPAERKETTVSTENFKPKPHGGWHYFFPYKHNYHHIIPIGAFRQIVIFGEVSDEAVTVRGRLDIVLCKKYLHWNINNPDNVVLLPSEEMHAEIVGLPAHCPWFTRSHPSWTDTIERSLIKVREALDGAVTNKDHETKIKAAEEKLKKTQTKLLRQLKKMARL
jgi:hypothetical protein